LRRGWRRKKWRVTQATLSRDLQELRLVKTHEGYRPAAALPEESNGLPSLARALGEFLVDIRPAENLLVLSPDHRLQCGDPQFPQREPDLPHRPGVTELRS